MPKSAVSSKVSSTVAAATPSSGGGSRKRKATNPIQNALKIRAPKRLKSDAPSRSRSSSATGKRQRSSSSSDENRLLLQQQQNRQQLAAAASSENGPCCVILQTLLSMVQKENAEVAAKTAVPHQKLQRKKKSFNTNLETVKQDLQGPFEDLIFRDIPDGVYTDKYEKDEDNFVLYRTASSSSAAATDSETDGGVTAVEGTAEEAAPPASKKIVIVEKKDGVMRANINFAMGLMTKVYANSTKFPVTGVENVRQGYNVPLNMYRILCYDASEELNPQFIMKNKDKIFTKKDLSPRDTRIFQFWGEMIDVGNSVEESLKQLIPFLKQNDLYYVKPPAPPKNKTGAAAAPAVAAAAKSSVSSAAETSSEGEEEDMEEEDEGTEEAEAIVSETE